MSPPDPTTTQIRRILEAAVHDGFHGFSGMCGQAAVAIDRILLNGRGEIVGAFNIAFLARERHIGHVAVAWNGRYWDADGRPKDVDDILSWGMLDPEDPDYIEEARLFGFEWTEEAAEEVSLVTLDPARALTIFGSDALAELEAILTRARDEILEP